MSLLQPVSYRGLESESFLRQTEVGKWVCIQ